MLKGSASPETPKPPKWNNGEAMAAENGIMAAGIQGCGSYNGGGRHWSGGNGGGIRTRKKEKITIYLMLLHLKF